MSVIVGENLDPFDVKEAVNDLLLLEINGEHCLVVLPTSVGRFVNASEIARAINDALQNIVNSYFNAFADCYGRIVLVSAAAITVLDSSGAKLLGFKPGKYREESAL